jgi:hypothetical protein
MGGGCDATNSLARGDIEYLPFAISVVAQNIAHPSPAGR